MSLAIVLKLRLMHTVTLTLKEKSDEGHVKKAACEEGMPGACEGHARGMHRSQCRV